MSDEIKIEEEKLAKNLSGDEREKKGFALLCYLQGFEAGYQSAIKKNEIDDKK